MSAILKATTVLGGLAVASAGATYTLRTPRQDFSNSALAAAEHGLNEVSAATKQKLPTNIFQFTVGGYKFTNVKSI